MRRIALLFCGMLLVPATSHAATFCVHSPESCSGTTASSVQEAVTAAALLPGRDEIRIGAGRFAESFSVAGGNELDMIGSGTGRTVLQVSGDDGAALDESGATLRGMTINGDVGTGPVLRLAGAAQDLVVTGAPGDPVAIRITGPATLLRTTVAGADVGVEVEAGVSGARLEEVEAYGRRSPAVVARGGVEIRRSTLFEVQALGASVLVENSVLLAGEIAGGAGGTGRAAEARTTALDDATLVLRNVTAVAAPSAGACRSFVATSENPARVATVQVLSTAGACAIALSRNGGAGGLASIRTSRSYYADSREAQGLGTFEESDSQTGTNPRFVSATDLRPDAASPLVDRGDAGAFSPGPVPAFDRAGSARVVDGNGDGSAVIDIGAFEHQHRRPRAELAASPVHVLPGDAVAFDASGSSDPDGDPLRLAYDFGDGTSLDGAAAKLSHRFSKPGRYSARVRATDASGLSDEAAVQIVVAQHVALSIPRTPLTRSGRLRVRVSCDERQRVGCDGTLKLRARYRGGSARTLGTVAFQARSGRSTLVSLRLSGSERRSIARRRSFTLSASAFYRDNGARARRERALIPVKVSSGVRRAYRRR